MKVIAGFRFASGASLRLRVNCRSVPSPLSEVRENNLTLGVLPLMDRFNPAIEGPRQIDLSEAARSWPDL